MRQATAAAREPEVIVGARVVQVGAALDALGQPDVVAGDENDGLALGKVEDRIRLGVLRIELGALKFEETTSPRWLSVRPFRVVAVIKKAETREPILQGEPDRLGRVANSGVGRRIG